MVNRQRALHRDLPGTGQVPVLRTTPLSAAERAEALAREEALARDWETQLKGLDKGGIIGPVTSSTDRTAPLGSGRKRLALSEAGQAERGGRSQRRACPMSCPLSDRPRADLEALQARVYDALEALGDDGGNVDRDLLPAASALWRLDRHLDEHLLELPGCDPADQLAHAIELAEGAER